jgi:hypothetical protein
MSNQTGERCTMFKKTAIKKHFIDTRIKVAVRALFSHLKDDNEIRLSSRIDVDDGGSRKVLDYEFDYCMAGDFYTFDLSYNERKLLRAYDTPNSWTGTNFDLMVPDSKTNRQAINGFILAVMCDITGINVIGKPEDIIQEVDEFLNRNS